MRKQNYQTKMVLSAPDHWTELQKNVDPSSDGSSRVTLSPVSSEDISLLQLNPDEIRLSTLIESGVVINPSDVRTLLNVTDRADIERFNNDRGAAIYQYLSDHPELVKVEEPVKEDK